MSFRSKQRGGTATENGGGKGALASKQMIDRIKEATGQSEEDITTMLMECNYDVNETIVALIENPFCQVTGKKDKLKKKDEDRKKDGFKVVEVRRQSTGSRHRTQERTGPPPSKPPPAARAPPTDMLQKPGDAAAVPGFVPSAGATLSSDQHVAAAPVAAAKPKTWAAAADRGPRAGGTMADLFKRPSQPPPQPTPQPPAAPAPHAAEGANGLSSALPPAPQAPASPAPSSVDALASAAPPPSAPPNAWGAKQAPPATGLGSSLLSALSSSGNPIAPDASLASASLSAGLPAPAIGGLAEPQGGVLFPQGGEQLSVTTTDRDLQVEFGAFSLNDSSSRSLSGALGLADARGPSGEAPQQPTSLGLELGTAPPPQPAAPASDPSASLGLGSYGAAPAGHKPVGPLDYSGAAQGYAGFAQPQPQQVPADGQDAAAALPDAGAAGVPPQYADYGAAPGQVGGLSSQYLGYGQGYGMQPMGGQYGAQYDASHLNVEDPSKAVYGGGYGMYGAAGGKQADQYGGKYGSGGPSGTTSVPSTAATDASLQSTPGAAAGGAAPQGGAASAYNPYQQMAYSAQGYGMQYGMQHPHQGYYGMPQANPYGNYAPAPAATPNAYGMPGGSYGGGGYQGNYPGSRGPQGGYAPAPGGSGYGGPNSSYGGSYQQQGGPQQGGLYGRGGQGGGYGQARGGGGYGGKQQGGDKFDAMPNYS